MCLNIVFEFGGDIGAAQEKFSAIFTEAVDAQRKQSAHFVVGGTLGHCNEIGSGATYA